MHSIDLNTVVPNESAEGLSTRDLRIMTAQKRAATIMQNQPERAHSTTATKARVGEGLTCRIQQGKFDAIADLGPGMGGDAAGPSPSFYARAAIASCVAIAIKMLAATEGMTFHNVDVTVETDMDDLALFGIGSSSAAPLETRVAIQIESDEDASDVSKIVSTALARDPWYLALQHEQNVTSALAINRATTATVRL
jgi:uncharacterized OsmC-like protein